MPRCWCGKPIRIDTGIATSRSLLLLVLYCGAHTVTDKKHRVTS